MLPLYTPRLLLRELEEADWPSVHAFHSDPAVVRYHLYDVYTEEGTQQHIQDRLHDRAVEPRTAWELAVTLTDSGRLIGRSGLQITSEPDREASLGFMFQRDVWGQGYATEAAQALLQLGFGPLGFHRIFAECDPRNLGSIRVLEKLGMRREAHLVENTFIKGEWCDTLIYALLEREWARSAGASA
jgi:[ribosomal protein S5]-alanine N-acetyltransferase